MRPRGPLPIRSLLDLPDDEAAAWIALFALGCAVPEGAPAPRTFASPPDPRPLSDAELVGRLMELPKPSLYQVEPGTPGYVVHCHPYAPSALELRTEMAERNAEMYRSMSVRRVLFASDHEAVVATVDAALRWEADYTVCVSSAGDQAGSAWAEEQEVYVAASAAGADFVYVFFSTMPRQGSAAA